MTNVKVNPSSRLIDSARAAQYANRDKLDRRDVANRAQEKVQTDVTREVKKSDPMATKKGPEGGQLEFETRRKPKLWTTKRRSPEGDGFLLVPNSPADGEFIGLLTGSRWSMAKYGNLGDNYALQNQASILGQVDGEVVTPFAFPGFEYVASTALPGEPSNAMMRNTATQSSRQIFNPKPFQGYPESFITQRQKISIFGSGLALPWETYDTFEDTMGVRNYGYFYHLASNQAPAKKPGLQGIGEPSTAQGFDSSNYLTCTFEAVISLGSAPAPTGEFITYDDYGTAFNYVGNNVWAGEASFLDVYIQYNGSPPPSTVERDSFLSTLRVRSITSSRPGAELSPRPPKPVSYFQEAHHGELLVLLGGIRFWFRALGLEDNAGKWEAVVRSSKHNLSGVDIILNENSEVHVAVVYSPTPDAIFPNETPSDAPAGPGVYIYINGSLVAARPDPGQNVMAIGFSGYSNKLTSTVKPSLPGQIGHKLVDLFAVPIGNNEYKWASTEVGNLPYRISVAEPTTECSVGFHSVRFTPKKALYKGQSFTPPTRISRLA